MPDHLPEINLHLPYITPELPGVGGKIRQKTKHFIVQEIPLYEPSGEGIHLYLNITKQDTTTRDIQIGLAKLFNLDPSQVGKAGLKDKYAIATQTLSVVFDGDQPDPEEKAQKIADKIHEIGIPNYYGVQRTGKEGENIKQGWLLLKNKKRIRDRWIRKLLLSSYQSYLCNRYLAQRVENEKYTELIQGDIAKKHDTGGEFHVEDLETEQKRFNNKEISFTAPMFGYKMREATDESGIFESSILNSVTITKKDFRKHHVKGTRRMGRILPEITLDTCEDGLMISFTLMKGSYATTVLREFMKNDVFAD